MQTRLPGSSIASRRPIRPAAWLAALAASIGLVGAAAGDEATRTVLQSARKLPVAAEVDVVVVGGSTGAVAAAVAAAEQGAKVFLVAPYPYLGDDMTATLRLWLEDGETPSHPLAERIFADRAAEGPSPNALRFTYQADRPSAALHRDTAPPSLLADGRWGDAAAQSVQYDGDVTITADLGKPERIAELRVAVYSRAEANAAGSGFNVESIAVTTSDDHSEWRDAAVLKGRAAGPEECYVLSAPIDRTARYVRLSVTKPAAYARVLLGEIEILGPPPKQSSKPAVPPPPRPMHVKKTLDEALLAAGVQYVYSSYATDVLRDADGNPAGIVLANRAGRQAVVAKTILDATDRALVARLSGARFAPYPAGMHTFRRTVIGGQPREADGMTARVIDPPFRGPYPNRAKTSSGVFPVIEYTLSLPMADDSHASWMKADQQARTMTYHHEQQWTSDLLFEIPPDPIEGRRPSRGAWPGAEQLPLEALRPAGVERLWVLGGCADVSREQAEELLRPVALMQLGTRAGRAAAEEAAGLPAPRDVRLPRPPQLGVDVGPSGGASLDLREALGGLRPVGSPKTIAQEATAVPVLGRYDVVVIGGGTGGAPAGIAAARQGARTLVVESLSGLGGVGTEGAISSYYWGNRVGFTATVLDGAASWPIEPKKEWWRAKLLEAGAEIWFATLGCGAVVEGSYVRGAVVATPFGRGVVLSDVVIDATGNSDVAAAAGAPTDYTDAGEFGMQGTGLPGRQLGGSYNNTDFNIVDETDMIDVWQTFVYSKHKYPDAFDHGRLIDTRERRRIAGEATLTLVDQMNRRTWPDTVARAYSNFDTHGYTIDAYTLVEHPEKAGFYVDIPFRAMLPKGIEGILVIGLGISAHRDAVPLIRMQPDIQNGGYAAGVAAAMAVNSRTALRSIDIRALQKHLVEIGNLPAEVLEHQDSYPLSIDAIAEAVRAVPAGKGAAVVLADPQRALPLVKEAFAAAEGDAKLVYAQLLAVLGDASGLGVMLERLRALDSWDPGWNYRGMGQFGSAYSPMDNLVVCIGQTGRKEAVPAIVEKLEKLSAGDAFSHHRAVARALELIGDPAAARPLAELLRKPGMSGHDHPDLEAALRHEVPGGTNAETSRRESLRELLLARALYRCGDHEGLGRRILENYAKDLRGHLARHAQAVLDERR